MTRAKNQDLELLRGVAIVFAMIHHSHVLFPWPVPIYEWVGRYFGFWSGVDLFFVISGFVITRSLSRFSDPERPTVSRFVDLKQFWLKRAFRLLPSAWVWLLIPLLATALMPDRSGFPSLATVFHDASAAFLNVANFYLPYCIGSGQVGSLCSSSLVLGHYWSLSVEELFYLALPVLIVLLPRRRLFYVLLVLICLQFGWNRPVLSYGWYSRTDGLMWGVVIALASSRSFYSRLEPTMLSRSVSRVGLFSIGVVMLALVPALVGGFSFVRLDSPSPITLGLLSMIAAVLVFVASFDKNYLLPDTPIKRMWVAIGTRSYSLYLAHLPCFLVAKELWLLSGWGDSLGTLEASLMILFLGVFGSVALAELSYRLIELPSREKGRQIAARIG